MMKAFPRNTTFSLTQRARIAENSTRSGFVLLLVLALIVIAGLVSAGVARRSLLIALESVNGADDLQTRWARVSLQRSVLLQANSILSAEMLRRPAEDRARSHFADVEIRLAGKDYLLRIADEEAKANLNTVFHTQGEAAVSQAVRALVGDSSGLSVNLRPFAVGDATERLPVFDSWGQVFHFSASQAPVSAAQKLMQVTTNVSCWGSGRLNLIRAPEIVTNTLLQPLDQTGFLNRLRQAHGGLSPRLLSQLLQQSPRNRTEEAFSEWISFRSGCYSLWIRTRDGQSERFELHIAEQAQGVQRQDIMSFVW